MPQRSPMPKLHRFLPPALWLFAFLLFALYPAATRAQYQHTPPRSVEGTVTDGGHEPLRGAVVKLETEGSMVIQSYITDKRGEYRFHNLPPDVDYTLWATFRGNKSRIERLNKFDHQADRTIDLRIELEK